MENEGLQTLRAVLQVAPSSGLIAQLLKLAGSPRLIDTAFEHGVAGVVVEALRNLPASLATCDLERATRRLRLEAVRQDANRKALALVLATLVRERIEAVVLKGPLLAARLYGTTVRPSADLDILVDRADRDQVVHALGPLGYVAEGGDAGRFFRDHHHHIHLLHATMPLVELHVEAYRGFGTTLPSAPLIARSIPCGVHGWSDARVLCPEDEILYLATHAASHRFSRLGWLYDMKLLSLRYPELDWDVTNRRAEEHGLISVVFLACTLLFEWLGVAGAPLPRVSPWVSARALAAKGLLRPSPSRSVDAVTSFAYMMLLCDDVSRTTEFARTFARKKLLHELPMRVRARVAS